MRILVYCDEDLSVAAGGARQVVELVKALVGRGHDLTVVAPSPIAECQDLSDLHGVALKTVPVLRRRGWRPLSFLVGSLTLLRRTLNDRRPDVFIWFDSPGQVAPLWAMRHCPLVYFVNGLPQEEVQGVWQCTPLRQVLSYGVRRAAERADALVAVCPELTERLSAFSRMDADRCVIIRNGVDPFRFFPQSPDKARRDLGLTGTGPYIMFVGGFFPWHGLETLIHAVPMVATLFPEVQVLLVGDGQTRAALEHLVGQKGLATHVRFAGRAAFDAVPAWIAAADVCVVLHKPIRSYPGDSMKLWEYLACGRPVVATAGPGYGETVEAMGAGLAAGPDDPADLAGQLTRLLANQDLRIRMGERGRDGVLEAHTWAARARQLEAVCHAAMDRRRAA